MGRAGGAGGGHSGGGHSGGGHSFGGGHSGGGRSSFGGGRNSSASSSGNGSGGSIFGDGSSGGNSGGGGGFHFDRRPSEQHETIIINNVEHNDAQDYNESLGNTVYVNTNNVKAPKLSGKGCLIAIAVIIGFFAFIALLDNTVGDGNGDGDSSDITVSTVEREPLPAGSVSETGYYTDELGWIGNQTELEKGMKNFYHATGVQPYLYITDNVNGIQITDVDELGVYAESLYQQLFTDEAHMLLVFYEYNGEYADYYLCGSQAKTVVDREAGDILLDYIDRYYYYDDMTDEEFFSTVFDKTATRIMTVEKSQWPLFWTGVITLIAIIVFFIGLAKFLRMRNEKAEQDAVILNTPLEKFEDGELENLVKKYEDS